MSAHTPGQWVAKHAEDGCGDIGIVGGDGVVAECFNEIRKARENAKDECLANARLIAAAPDLLAALQELSTAADNLDPQAGVPIGYQRLLDAVSAADAVILKATGATP
jgi:hypothetical protein